MTPPAVEHVAWVLFLWVLANQAGVPLPVVPPLLAAGTVARSNADLLAILVVVAVAALCADVVWFGLGRWRGAEALGPLRRRSTWVSARIDRIAHLSGLRGAVFLLGARFLPELNPVAAALAGATRGTLGRYFARAAATALLWAATWTGLGYTLGAMAAKRFQLL